MRLQIATVVRVVKYHVGRNLGTMARRSRSKRAPRGKKQMGERKAPRPAAAVEGVEGRLREGGAPTLEMPKPTPDQLRYLDGVRRSEGKYDPKVVVGGPRPPRS
jgi:hypothetical protein